MSETTRPPVTIQNCADEPIHIPGAIQPFAFVLAVNSNGQVAHVSSNLLDLLRLSVDQVLNQSLQSITQLAPLAELIACSTKTFHHATLAGEEVVVRKTGATDRDPMIIFEIEQQDRWLFSSQEFQNNLQLVLSNLFQCRDTATLYSSLVDQLSTLLGYDRVMVYQFDKDWNGSIIAEQKGELPETFLGLHYPASDIPEQARNLYTRKLTRLIADVSYESVDLVSAQNTRSLDLSDVDCRAISPIHIQYLKNMGVTATLVISLMVEGKLWGLIACHHYSGKKFLNHSTRKSCENLAIATSLLIERLQNQAIQRAKQAFQQDLKVSEVFNFLCNAEANPAVASNILKLTNCCGFALVSADETTTYGQVPGGEWVKALAAHKNDNDTSLIYCDALQQLFPELAGEEIAGACIVALTTDLQRQSRHPILILFRSEITRSIHWAGDPYHKTLQQSEAGIAQLSPRRSFALWSEQKKGHCADWTDHDKAVIEELQVVMAESYFMQSQILREHEHQLLSESTDIGLWSLDIPSLSLYWSDRMFDIYGVPKRDFRGQYSQWFEALVTSDRDRVTSEFERSLHYKRPYSGLFRINHPQKGTRTIRVHTSMVLSNSGNPVKVIGTNIDVTDQVEMHKALLEQIKISTNQSKLASLGELVATVGHEINNPLAVIMSSMELQKFALSANPPRTADAMDCNDKSLKATERISKIVSGLRVLARRPQDDSASHICKVADVTAEIIAMMRELYRKDGVQLINEISVSDLQLAADASTLQQVLVNLIANAKDAIFSCEQKIIRLTMEQDDRFGYLHVIDSGKGVPDELQERIFESFFTTKKQGQGTGLGLSISRTLLRDIGGDLFARTIEEGGAEFTMKIPIGDSNIPQLAGQTEKIMGKAAGEALSVLLVDDEDGLREVLSQHLSILKCVVTQTRSAEEALEVLGKKTFDVLITDSYMPGMNGEELLKQTQSLDIKRVLMTGDVNKNLEDIKNMGVPLDLILHKPIKQTQLVTLLHQVKRC